MWSIAAPLESCGEYDSSRGNRKYKQTKSIVSIQVIDRYATFLLVSFQPMPFEEQTFIFDEEIIEIDVAVFTFLRHY